MTPDAYADHIQRFKDLAAPVSVTATSDDLLAMADSLLLKMSDQEKDVAATMYLLRVVKDAHRQAVLAVERNSVRRRIAHRAQTPEELARMQSDREQYERDRASLESEMFTELQGIVGKYVDRLKVEWTQELLDSTFAMPDGTFVSWGAATVEQHECRRTMLMQNARGNMQAAARHDAAIRDLSAAGATNLYETRP